MAGAVSKPGFWRRALDCDGSLARSLFSWESLRWGLFCCWRVRVVRYVVCPDGGLFLSVVVGYVVARLKFMDDGFDNQLSKLGLNVTLPCMLVASASTSDGLPDAATSMELLSLSTLGFERYPDADIVLVTSAKTSGLPAEGLPAFYERNAAGLVQADYATALRDVAGWYGLPVIDLFDESGMSALSAAHKPRLMPDGLHFSPAGYERLARRIASELLRVAAF